MTYGEFWPHYLAAHADRRNRALHYAGTLAALGLLGAGRGRRQTGAGRLAAMTVGYAPAWFGHAVFERNRPGDFRRTRSGRWSAISACSALFLTGRLADEISRQQAGR